MSEYRGNGQHTWEGVVTVGGYSVDRLCVPGGWIYRDMRTGGVVFVPLELSKYEGS